MYLGSKSLGYRKYLRKKTYYKLIILFTQIILFVGLLGLWELAAKYKLIDTFIFSSPSRIFDIFKTYLDSNQIFHHTWISVKETLYGLLIGTLLGIFIAIILWYVPFIAKVLDPFLIVFNALPKTALAPIFIIWIGTNIKGVVFTAVSISIVLTIISAYNNFKNVDSEKIKMMKCFKATKFQTLRMLIIPSNTENILNMVKINIGMSWIGVIVAEFIVSRAGLGYLINYGSQKFNLDLVMMGVAVLAIVTLIMYGIINLLEKIYKKIKGW